MYFLAIQSNSGWSSFLGHFHPVIVHLPIGMLVIAFMLEIAARLSRTTQWDKAIAFILLWGSLSAVISALLGWLLSLSGGYNEHTLFLHQWAGISLALLSGICWYLKTRTESSKSINITYCILLCLMILLLTITGHLGGSITHGEGYLTADMPEPLRGWIGVNSKPANAGIKKITNINEAVVYQDLVSPVLQSKCWSCHNEDKSKGKFRMDTQELLMKGGEHGSVIKKNNADASELIKRILLPADDEHRMPPKGKEPLTTDEISLIKWWINTGADVSKKVKDLKPDEPTKQLLARITGGTATMQTDNSTTDSKPSSLPAIFSQKIAPANNADVEVLKKLSVLVSPIAQGQNYLAVSCINAPGFGDTQINLLTKLSLQITWLQLNNTKITDAALAQIAKMPNLTRLNLANTAITSKGIRLINSLPNLEYLNLTGTHIDDSGLKELSNLHQLKYIYCWNTQVTAQGASAFQKALPKAQLILE